MMMSQHSVRATFCHEISVVLETIEGSDQHQHVRTHVDGRFVDGKECLPDFERCDILIHRRQVSQSAIDPLESNIVVQERVTNRSVGATNYTAVAREKHLVGPPA